MKKIIASFTLSATLLSPAFAAAAAGVEGGVRPLHLVDRMVDGPPKDKLASCMELNRT